MRKQKEEKKELQQQIEAIYYQLKLLEKLDGFRSDNLTTEKEIRQALSIEKQYSALYAKERNLKAKLQEIDENPY